MATTTTTTALQSVSLWQSQTQSSSSQSVLNSTAFFVSPRIASRRKKLPLHRYLLNSKNPRFPSSVFTDGSSRFILNASSASTTTTSSDAAETVLDVGEIKQKCRKWQWKGQYSINYFVSSDEVDSAQKLQSDPPLLLVHGFGASIPHWRRNIKTLARSHTVYAIDLLGFGASDKPPGFSYTMETWAQLILDFLDEVIQKPTVLVGNSVGSLACVIAASVSNQIQGIASAIFERVKQRENLRNILLSVYGNKESVDEELVEIIREPANDVGALDAFVSIVTGPPGPNPVQLMPRISSPILVLWGDQDPFTPIDGPVGKYFSSLPFQQANVELSMLEGVGHCPHDDRPDSVHEKLLPWLASLPTS